jgi:hypothetical protein
MTWQDKSMYWDAPIKRRRTQTGGGGGGGEGGQGEELGDRLSRSAGR